MRVVIRFDPAAWIYYIYVLRQDMGTTGWAYVLGANATPGWREYELGTEPPPFQIWTKEIYEAVMGEALNLGIPNRPDELADCRKVRDRLLTMVENSINELTGK
jgi:hypothetical protein